ncbi:MAG: pilin protein MshD [Pseudomonadota bacterium]|nr:pilin protein MshD [Pseudomonadota bacterium]
MPAESTNSGSPRPYGLRDDGINQHSSERGLSLIELLVFIVVVGIAVGGVLSVYSLNTRSSADPMVRKQALAIAESLLEEVLAKPYTYCDPDDADADTATGAFVGVDGCDATVETIGPEGVEDRYSNVTPYDNVNDYDGFSMTGIDDLTGTAIAGLAGYIASVQVQPVADFNGIVPVVAGDNEALLVTVTVTAPGNHSVSLSGYRTRYAPKF